MIKVDVALNEFKKIRSINLSGHAGMAKEGKDVVCAGVSSCFVGAMNAIKDYDNFEIKINKGLGSVVAKGEVNPHDEIVLEVLLTQLKSIEFSYSQYLKINYVKEGTK